MNYSSSDVNKSLAIEAYRGNSFTPEKRAEQVVAEYMADMKRLVEIFEPMATDHNRAELAAEMEKYRVGYLKYQNAWLSALGRCMSAMVTGPSNFPTERNRKRNATETKRSQEFIEWRKKALARLHKRFNPAVYGRGPISADDPDAVQQLQKKIEAAEKKQEFMKAINKIVRSKKPVEDRVKLLMDYGDKTITEATARRFVTEPNGHGGLGFPSYELTNNGANIRRMKERIVELEKEAARPEVPERIIGDNIRVVENRDENRIQFIFPDKPAQWIRDLLSSRGFNWSRYEGAWQRQLTGNARWTTEQIIKEIEGEAPVEELERTVK